MTTASQMVHAAGGSRTRADCTDRDTFACYVCAGTATRGMLRDDWMGENFTAQARVRSPESALVCESCVVVMAGKPPNTERFFSHLVDDRGHHRVNKGGKALIRDWLRAPKSGPWLAAIADSGQRHVLPFAPVNPGCGRGGRVMFEETLVVLPASPDAWAIVDAMTSLLTAGATKDELLTGSLGPRAWQLCGVELRAFEDRFGGQRTGAWFELALWLAQRDEVAVATRQATEKATKEAKANAGRKTKGSAKDPDGGGAARSARGVPRDGGGKRAQALGHDPGATPGVVPVERDGGAVDHVDGPLAPVAGSQRSLF